MIVSLESPLLKIAVNTYGGELHSIRDREEIEYLWQGDSRYWEDQAPNIFPYVGRLTEKKYRYQGKEFSMGIHGFVQDSELEPVEQSSSSVRLRLSSNLRTKVMYPFDFEYEVAYFLEGCCLQICYKIKNTGNKQMYFGVGGHPGFQVPLNEGEQFDDYYLEFDRECRPRRIGFSADCFLNGCEEEFPLEDKRIYLKHSMFDDDAVVLKNMDNSVMLTAVQGKRYVKVCYPQMDYLGIWHAPCSEAPYVCIEPWSSLPSRKGIVEDLEKQPDLIMLKEGETYRNTWSIECGKF